MCNKFDMCNMLHIFSVVRSISRLVARRRDKWHFPLKIGTTARLATVGSKKPAHEAHAEDLKIYLA
jgi:hypothetical protein